MSLSIVDEDRENLTSALTDVNVQFGDVFGQTECDWSLTDPQMRTQWTMTRVVPATGCQRLSFSRVFSYDAISRCITSGSATFNRNYRLPPPQVSQVVTTDFETNLIVVPKPPVAAPVMPPQEPPVSPPINPPVAPAPVAGRSIDFLVTQQVRFHHKPSSKEKISLFFPVFSWTSLMLVVCVP